jgi:BASS family bile acid:Na+ symporter
VGLEHIACNCRSGPGGFRMIHSHLPLPPRTNGHTHMQQPAWLESLASASNRAFLPLLLAVYVIAAIAPAPAVADDGVLGIRASHVILACLVFLAGLRTGLPRRARARFAGIGLVGAGLFGRFIPLLITLCAVRLTSIMETLSMASDVVTGLILVAAMPSANTATVWTRRSSGNLALCVGVVLMTTLFSPLVVPLSLAMAGHSAGLPVDAFSQLSGAVVAWVFVPMVLGMWLGRAFEVKQGLPLGAGGALGTLVALLSLNYLNASRALPGLFEAGGFVSLAWAAAGAAALVLVSYAVGGFVAQVLRAGKPARTALSYAVGMSNTGIAGTLAISAFPERPDVLYPVVMCTLLQHVVAALLDSRSSSQIGGAPTVRPESAAAR